MVRDTFSPVCKAVPSRLAEDASVRCFSIEWANTGTIQAGPIHHSGEQLISGTIFWEEFFGGRDLRLEAGAPLMAIRPSLKPGKFHLARSRFHHSSRLRTRFVGDDFSVPHLNLPVGEAGEGRIVSDKDEGGEIAGGDGLEGVHHMGGVGAVEISGGFISEEETGMTGKGPGEGDALHLPAAELVREMGGAVGEPDKFQHFLHPNPGDPGRIAAEEEGEFNVLAHGHGGQEIEKLKDNSEIKAAMAGQGGVTGVVKGKVADPDFPFVRGIQAAKEIEEGAFPAATGAGDRNKGAEGNL